MPVATTDAFRRITVQPDNVTIVAEQVGDTLTLVAGSGISLVANTASDQITIVNTNTSSPSTELFAKSLTVDGIIIDTNVIRSTDSNADLEIYANGTGAVKLLSDLVVSGNIKAIASVGSNGNDLTVQAGETVGGNGGDLTLKSGETTTGNGGIVYIKAGDTTTGNGGGIDLRAGDTIAGDGGSIFITAGSSIGTGPGGSVTITSGDNLSNDAGDINLVAATSSSGADGVINLTTAIGSWTFNEAGNLTFPIGLTIEDFSGTPMIRSANGLAAVLGGAPALPGTSIIIQAGNAGADDGVDPMTGQTGGALIIAGGQGTGDFTGGSVSIFGGADANGDFADVVIGNGPTAFTFYGNGTLEFPDSTIQSTAWTGDVGDDITVGSIRINTNVIQTVDSNADLELRASGTGSIRLNANNVTIGSNAGATSLEFTGSTISTSDSSGITVDVPTTFNSDVSVQNDLNVGRVRFPDSTIQTTAWPGSIPTSIVSSNITVNGTNAYTLTGSPAATPLTITVTPNTATSLITVTFQFTWHPSEPEASGSTGMRLFIYKNGVQQSSSEYLVFTSGNGDVYNSYPVHYSWPDVSGTTSPVTYTVYANKTGGNGGTIGMALESKFPCWATIVG